MSGKKLTVDAELEKLQRETFGYFLHETNPANGLVIDKTAVDWPASIAATGLALAAYPVGVERGFISRAAAVERTLATLRFFWNSRRATYVQQQYAIDNPLKFEGYGRHCWGITASEGPGPDTIKVNGIERQFFDYVGRGVPYGPDDGTLAPWAVVASLPFAPEIVLPALDYCIHQAKLTEFNSYGFKASFNPSHPGKSGNPYGWWVSPWHYGLNQGPIILMIENYRTRLLWRLMRNCPYIVSGLRRAGFDGGWL